jgi:hypothetical protein
VKTVDKIKTEKQPNEKTKNTLKFKRVVGFSSLDFEKGSRIFTLRTYQWRFGFYPWVLGSTLGSKKIITWVFNQVLEERVRFNSRVLKKGYRFVPSGLRFYPLIKEDYYLVFQTSLGREGWI